MNLYSGNPYLNLIIIANIFKNMGRRRAQKVNAYSKSTKKK